VTLKRLWKNYNLSVVLATLFLLSWVGQAIFQWREFVDEQRTHGQAVQVAAFLNEFFRATFENWQSEFLQLLTFVILTSFLIHRGSHESKDEDEKMEKKLQEISRKLDALGGGTGRESRSR
jgi:hypothetical protein